MFQTFYAKVKAIYWETVSVKAAAINCILSARFVKMFVCAFGIKIYPICCRDF